VKVTEKRLRQIVGEEIKSVVEGLSAPAMPTKRSQGELGDRALALGMGWGPGSDRRYATTRWFAAETPPGLSSEEDAKSWLSANVNWYNRYWGDLGYDEESGTWITTRELDTTG
tara:strand:+ start:3524 stop:3865 length:342 start_codon:yes stop_codon:yes gene_type:complete